MLALFDTGVEVLMIAFAFIHHDGHRLGAQIDFDEPSILIAVVICDCEEVRLELDIVTFVLKRPPAIWFPFDLSEHYLSVLPADLD